MDREKAIAKLKELQESNDTEAAHYDADDVLTALLMALGYEDVVVEYGLIHKWFA